MLNLSAHKFSIIYWDLNIDINKLGCVMLDVDPLDTMKPYKFDGLESSLYNAKDKSMFWVDGWMADKNPHITLLYGLLKSAREYKNKIKVVLKDWNLKEIEIADIGFFDSPMSSEPYYCIVAHIKPTLGLLEGHARLEFLPHVNTHTFFKPHFTLCYIGKDRGEKYRDNLIGIFKKMWVGKKMKVRPGLNLGK